MKDFFKLYSNYFVRNRQAMFLTFFFPLMMVFILGGFMPANYILPGLMLLPAITSSFFFTPTGIFEWRDSALIKRIGITPLKKRDFFLGIFFVHLIAAIIGLFFLAGFIAIINSTTTYFRVPDITTGLLVGKKNAFDWTQIDYLHSTFYFLLLTMFAISTGMVVGMFVKKQTLAFNIGMLLYFTTTFLGGVFFDVTMIYEIMPLKYTSFGIPWTWTSKSFIAAMSGSFVFYGNTDLIDPTTGNVLASGALLDWTNIIGYALPAFGTVSMLSIVTYKASFSEVK